MRQPNGCSTHAPKTSAAKQWIKEELAQTKEEEESVGTVDLMCFPWQQQNAQQTTNESLKKLGFAFLSRLEQGARSFSVFLQLRQIFCR